MTSLQILFYLFSIVAIFSGTMVVISRHPVRSVLFLILTFFAMAGVWLLLQAEFLALILVVVYVGAVMTLFLFIVMMLYVNIASEQKAYVRYLPFAMMIALLTVALIIMAVGPSTFGLAHVTPPPMKAEDYNNIKALGSMLYTDYVYPFEIAAVLLLAAIVAAISLSHRSPRGRKVQRVSEQIAVRREDRVKLIKMASEKNNSLKGAS